MHLPQAECLMTTTNDNVCCIMLALLIDSVQSPTQLCRNSYMTYLQWPLPAKHCSCASFADEESPESFFKCTADRFDVEEDEEEEGSDGEPKPKKKRSRAKAGATETDKKPR